MRVVYWANAGLAKAQVIEVLSHMKELDFTVADTLRELLKVLPETEGLVLFDPPQAQARQLVDALKATHSKLRWLHFLSAGREGIESAGLPASVEVSYAPGATAPVVAEHAFALLLALCRRLPEALAAQSTGHWDRSMSMAARSIEGCTMAIVGYGHIGKELARRAQAFGMKTVSVSRSPSKDELLDDALAIGDLHKVLATADVVVISMALTPETRHMFDAAAFAAMKRGALLINVARGGLVDQPALVAALASGHLGGAGLDVTDPEPLPDGDPLWTAPNLALSPHYGGGGSPKSVARIVAGLVDNARRQSARK